MAPPLSPLRLELMRRMQAGAAAGQVFTWSDFADLGPHEIVERHLLRLAAVGETAYEASRKSGDWEPFFADFRVMRVARGIYYSPVRNRMTKRPTVPMAENVVAAVVSRLGGRWLVPPEAAAHELGITNLVRRGSSSRRTCGSSRSRWATGRSSSRREARGVSTGPAAPAASSSRRSPGPRTC